jgi:fatty-acyl-CoA synthase
MALELIRKTVRSLVLNGKLVIAVLRWALKTMFQLSPVIVKTNKKLSYVSTTCRENLIYTTIGERLFEMAEKYPDHVAYILHRNNGLTLTLADAKDRAARLAQNFLHIGLKKGDRIATLVPNTYELIICYLASAINGHIIVPLDQDYGSAELEYMIQKTSPTAIVVYNSDEFETTVNDLFPNINSFEKGNYVNEKFPGLKHLMFLKELNKDCKNAWTWSEVADRQLNKGPAYEFPFVEPEDIFAIIFTSGTTGRPKGTNSCYL